MRKMKWTLLIVALFALTVCKGIPVEDKRSYVDTVNTDELEQWQFRYDGQSHQMAFRDKHDHKAECYIYNLSDADRALVHSPEGLMQIEIRVLQLSTRAHTVTGNLNGTASHLQRYCRTKSGYYIVYLN